MTYQDCDNCTGRITGLAHIGIQVTDLDEMLSFLVDTLGFTVTSREDLGATKLVFLNIGTCLLELVYNPANTPRPAGIVDHICVEVEDIYSLVCRLDKKGVHFLSDTVGEMAMLGGVRNIFLEGPQGLKMEFFEYTGRK